MIAKTSQVSVDFVLELIGQKAIDPPDQPDGKSAWDTSRVVTTLKTRRSRIPETMQCQS
jgi:hypothetical protein